MQTTSFDPRATAQAGIDKLRAGDAAGARKLLEKVAAAGHADASVFHCLAHACAALRDLPAALAAADRALATAPANMQSLLLKADLLVASGDGRAAVAFYQAAIKAAPPQEQMPAFMRQELARAQGKCDEYAAKFASHLMTRLASGGGEQRQSPRFRESIDLLLGKKQVYLQSPRYFYFPGLPQIQFFETDAFPWIGKLEAATAAIRAEALAVMSDPDAFEPYVKHDPKRPMRNQEGLNNNPDWSAFYLWKDGELVAENAARCPATMAALEGVPMPRVKGRSPSVLFSLLRPGAYIPPHTGVLNTRLICHLPLVVPGGCSLRVGNDTRECVEGRAWVFDDSIEHEAWNRSSQPRVILLFDIWRPELTGDERAMVAEMFAAIDDYSDARTEWGM
ncbi:aspartyl/asparaginyl beta-hydroxylase domain-containing protein [Massilia cavernae]|uniref:Aspartyl/asparaginy/proline hydroxylase domain-containing protein n=1 Tax=Massilia cavernae TaxID=2320864 RepID=A0A418XFW7_9BURK|nr:aspartyl/asparaginyl beta-hydroxylase domain-containing protein [Massilia cavernae]RJG11363.1 hypothetical protein D3872_19710 [Massilia cavernae]